jgi:lipoprotein LpqS
MEVTAVRPMRLHVAVAVSVVLCLLGLTVFQCGLLSGDESLPPHSHDLSATSQTTPREMSQSSPDSVGHSHIQPGSTRDVHDVQPTVQRPRTDNPLRPLGLVAAAVITLVAAMLSLVLSARGPPRSPIPARSGRAILQVLCIARC